MTTVSNGLIDIYLIIIFLLSGKGKASNFHFIMDRNRDYRDSGGRNAPGIPGGVRSFEPWQRGGSDRGPPEPRSSGDRRSRERHVPVDFRDFPSSTHNRSPPRPHRRSRSPGKWFRNFSPFSQNVIIVGLAALDALNHFKTAQKGLGLFCCCYPYYYFVDRQMTLMTPNYM